MRGNIVPAWPSIFIVADMVLKDETVAVVAVENDSLKVQRDDGSETLFPLGAGFACLMWGRDGN